MKILFRVLAVILFIIFFGFALKNTSDVALKFFWDYEMRGPLVLLLLGFFVGGAVLGVLAMTPTVFRYRRELSKQRKMVAAMQKENEAQEQARNQPPQPAPIVGT
ncbi:MAG: DUF1049 domain-containing protein [Burkholderiales bacterium]|nr:DUF1049 domain-containing protein [Burkholderiales bacterium]